MNSNPSPASDLTPGGWTFQFTIEAERAQEYIELYKSLGNEVQIRTLNPGNPQNDACCNCLNAASGRYIAIYTRSGNAEVEV